MYMRNKCSIAVMGALIAADGGNDVGGMSAPTVASAPGFKVTTPRGSDVLPGISLGSLDDAKAAFRNTANVETLSAAAIRIIVATIKQYPAEFKVAPLKDNRAGQIMAETEKELFGEHKLPDAWRTNKSMYLKFYRAHGDPNGAAAKPLWIERGGETWIRPFRSVQQVMANDAPDPKGDDDRLVDAVKLAIGRGVKEETVSTVMQMLGEYRDAIIKAKASGDVAGTKPGVQRLEVVDEVVSKKVQAA